MDIQHAQTLNRARDVLFYPRLPLVPYIMRANSEVPGETARVRRLACAFAVRPCDKYSFLMNRLKCQNKGLLNGMYLNW